MTDIDFSNIDVDCDISILIGADKPVLHLYRDIRVGNENEPVALKTKLGWVILGGRQNNNKYPSDDDPFCLAKRQSDVLGGWVGKNIFMFCVTRWFQRKSHFKRKNIINKK